MVDRAQVLWPNWPVFLLFIAVPAWSAEQSAEADDPVPLEEVLVTAAKREQNLQDVPIGMTALTEYELERIGTWHIEDYARSVPGVSLIKNGIGGPTVVMRGISSTANVEGTPLTALYLDEVPMTRATSFGMAFSPDITLVDVDRIEVLRGPKRI